MKKIIISIVATLFVAGVASAQDLASAIEAYNNGAEALSLGDKAAALSNFRSALSIAEACGEDGAEVVANCQTIIPKTILSEGKDFIKAKDYESALTKVEESARLAADYGQDDVVAEASSLIPQIYMAEANAAFQAKDIPTATEGYRKVLSVDANNGAAALRMVQCLTATGDIEGAVEYCTIAEACGQGENARKSMGSTYLKKASASLKAGRYAEAISEANTANSYSENAQAYLIAGQASNKLNKTPDAISNFEKYLEASPDAKNAGTIALTLGALYQGQGNKTKALEYYNKAQSLGTDAKQYIDALNK